MQRRSAYRPSDGSPSTGPWAPGRLPGSEPRESRSGAIALRGLAAALTVAAWLGMPTDALGQRRPATSAPEQRLFEWTEPQFSQDEYRARRAAVMANLQQSGGGVLLVPGAEGTSFGETFRQLDDFLYLTGLELPGSMLALDTDLDRTFLFTPDRDPRFESASRPNDFPGRPLADDPDLLPRSGVDEIISADQLESWLSIWNSGRQTFRVNAGRPGVVDFIGTRPTAAWTPARQLILHLQRTFPATVIENAYADIARVRMVKSPAEIDVMRRAALLTGDAIRKTARQIGAGVDERALQGVFTSVCLAGGAQRVPFTPIIKSGPNSLWPWRILASHYNRRNRTLAEGELVILDVGCELDYYVSDVGRTFPVSGRFTERQRALVGMVTAVSDAVLRAIRPGVTLGDLQGIADAAIPPNHKRYMQTAIFMGHHLGLSAGDPSLPDEPLRPGMIFTVEPWYYNHDDGIAVFIEDEVLVTIYGSELLTADLPRHPDELERLVGSSGNR